MKISVMIGRFPFLNQECPDSTDWLVATVLKAHGDSRIEHCETRRVDTTPITKGRNWMVEEAKRAKVDYLVMLDSDMCPDLPGRGAKPFWESTLDFMLKNRQPCMVAVPYCGPPPLENVYVFRWAKWNNSNVSPDCRLDFFSREEAAGLAGIQRVGALPTGLIMIDMRVFEKMTPPYFYYEYKDETQSELASTEDVTFTRDANMLGIPIYCNWDAWAGHHKRYRVDKPLVIHSDHVRKNYTDAVLRQHHSQEKMVVLGEGTEHETGRIEELPPLEPAGHGEEAAATPDRAAVDINV